MKRAHDGESSDAPPKSTPRLLADTSGQPEHAAVPMNPIPAAQVMVNPPHGAPSMMMTHESLNIPVASVSAKQAETMASSKMAPVAAAVPVQATPQQDAPHIPGTYTHAQSVPQQARKVDMRPIQPVHVAPNTQPSGIAPRVPAVASKAEPQTGRSVQAVADARLLDMKQEATPLKPGQDASLMKTASHLRVEDALSYLDKVKETFSAENSTVYNQFLDIMKEFKSGDIDTPGVIRNVSELFGEFPDLVVGFNTFLPDDYHIEVDRSQPTRLIVRQNVAGASSTQVDLETFKQMHSDSKPAVAQPQPVQQAPQVAGSRPLAAKEPSMLSAIPPGSLPHPSAAPAAAPLHVSTSTQSQLPVAPRQVGQAAAGATQAGAAQVPIKAEQDASSATIAYAASAPAPVATAAVGTSAGAPAIKTSPVPAPEGEQPDDDQQPRKQLEFSHAIRYVNKIKHRFTSQLTVYKSFLEILHTYQKEQKSINEVYAQVAALFQNHADLLEEFSQFLPEAVPAAQAHMEKLRKLERKSGSQRSARRDSDGGETRPKKRRDLTSDLAADGFNSEELDFFDKIKKVMRPTSVYDNFLRCLSLYAKELISAQDLLGITEPFLNKQPDLYNWMKNFLGLGDGIDEDTPLPDLDLANAERLDISYRALPESHQKVSCSGRSELAPSIRNTLNNEWVSFPVWTSEDSQFVSSKKNTHEEALFRCEDERFELDLILESNLAAIHVLDMEYSKIKDLSATKLKDYVFDSQTMGGRSKVIARKAIKRIYGTRATDVFSALERDPASFIPIVLERLRQKQTEWRKVQRQWNESWRDVVEKNYLKSLDVKGSNFKRSDVNNHRSKAIKQSFKDRREEMRKAMKLKQSDVKVDVAAVLPREELDFSLPEIVAIVEEFVALCIPKQSSTEESQAKATELLKVFIHDYLTSSASAPAPPAAKEAQGDQVAASKQDDTVPSKDKEAEVKMDEQADDAPAAGPSSSDQSPPKADTSSRKTVMWPTMNFEQKGKSQPSPDQTFFVSGRWAVFFVQFHMLYTRIANIFRLCQKLEAAAAKKIDSKDVPASVSLALCTPNDVKPAEYFSTFLSLTKQLLEGQLESSAYEDTMREMFSTSAYPLYTIDKLVPVIARQVHVLTEEIPELLAGAYLRRNGQSSESADDILDVDKYLEYVMHRTGDTKNIYKVHKMDGKFYVQLLDLEAGPDGTVATADKAWLAYVADYTQADVNHELLQYSKSFPLFVQSVARRCGYLKQNHTHFLCHSKLECHFSLNLYKLSFVALSWDLFYRPHNMRPSLSKQACTERQTQVLQTRFQKHRAKMAAWAAKNVTPEQRHEAEAFFRGPDGQDVQVEHVQAAGADYRRFAAAPTA